MRASNLPCVTHHPSRRDSPRHPPHERSERPTSLATYRVHQPAATRAARCPRFEHVIGDRRPACMRTCCPICVRAVAVEAGRAMALVAPTHSYLLTLVGPDWQAIQTNMTRLVRRVRRRNPKFQHAWHVEANPDGTGNHIHGWCWGDIPAEGLLREAAVMSGMGSFVSIRPWRLRKSDDPVIAYGMKAVTGPQFGRSSEAQEFLGLNGGKVMHASRGFYRDPSTGEQFVTRRDAERRARLRRRASTRTRRHS